MPIGLKGQICRKTFFSIYWIYKKQDRGILATMDRNGQKDETQKIIDELQAHIEDQKERLAEKDATIADLRRLIDELLSLKANLEETLAEFRRQLFGTRSEKTGSKSTDETVPEKGDGSETGSGTVNVKPHVRKRKAKSKREDIYADLPIRQVVIPLTDEQRRCAYCNAEMVVIGQTKVREEIRITPAKVERIQYMQEVAICPECKSDGDGTIVKSAPPKALLPHSPASPSSVAYIMFEKTFMGMPYYRQEGSLFQLGLNLPRETMANWYITCAERYFYPIYERMHKYLIKRDVLHADETTCQVLREKDKAPESESFMWIYLTGNDGLPPIVMYEYQPGRGGKYPKSFLEGFSGLLQCDGYQGYNSVEDVVLVCCLAHCRRKFYEALSADQKKKHKLLDISSAEAIKEPVLPAKEEWGNMIPAEVGLVYCNALFYIERQIKEMSPEERKEKRQKSEISIWNDFWKWLDTINPLGGSKLEKAVKYAYNHKETLMNYLLDGRCEISNNAAERKAKSYAIGRRSFLFHTSEKGAAASAVMYSIVETAKANGLNVFQYLYMVLLYMPDHKNKSAGLEKLLPWSDFIKEHCTGLIDVENITPENHIPLP